MVTRRPMPRMGCIDVWLLWEDDEPFGLDRIELDAGESAGADRMATPELRARARRRRRFLRRVLSAYLGVRPEAVPIGIASGGKPILAGEAGLHFNLSHSGGVSMLALGACALGLDVERPKSFDRLADVVDYSCSPRERAVVTAAPDAASAFLDRWVLKEAILKCRGTGLVDDLRTVDPGPVGPEPVRWQDLTLRRLCPPAAQASEAPLHVALAVAGPADRIDWHRLDP